jgi:hypothetical protein
MPAEKAISFPFLKTARAALFTAGIVMANPFAWSAADAPFWARGRDTSGLQQQGWPGQMELARRNEM